MTHKTVASAFGADIADELARWAIDALVEPPEKIASYTTKIRADHVREGRAILDRAGIDWARFHRELVERREETAARIREEENTNG